MDEHAGDGEVYRQRPRFSDLIAPISAEPAANRHRGSLPPRPMAVGEEVLNRDKLERDGGGGERGKSRGAREQRYRRNLDEKACEPNEVEDTPPPHIEVHT